MQESDVSEYYPIYHPVEIRNQLVAEWKSSLFPGNIARCEFTFHGDGNEFDLIFTYSDKSKFSARKQMIFSMYGAYDEKRLVAQSTLNTNTQLILTISFEPLCGFISLVFPMDCGSLTFVDPSSWHKWARI